MKGFVLVVVGVLAGFVAAHLLSRTPQGRVFLDDVGAKATAFGAAVADGYRAQQAEFRADS